MVHTRPDIVYLDAAGTLIEVAEPVGDVYASAARAAGLELNPQAVQRAFHQAWTTQPPPLYLLGPDEAVDRAWWRAIVQKAFRIVQPVWPGAFDFQSCFEVLFSHYARSHAWRLVPEAPEALTWLCRRFRLGVLSNFDARLHTVLEGLGVRRHFSQVVLSSESGAVKPAREIFLRAAQLAECAPGQCLHAGDDPVRDWRGAEEAGFHVFRLARPHHGLQALCDELRRFDR